MVRASKNKIVSFFCTTSKSHKQYTSKDIHNGACVRGIIKFLCWFVQRNYNPLSTGATKGPFSLKSTLQMSPWQLWVITYIPTKQSPFIVSSHMSTTTLDKYAKATACLSKNISNICDLSIMHETTENESSMGRYQMAKVGSVTRFPLPYPIGSTQCHGHPGIFLWKTP